MDELNQNLTTDSSQVPKVQQVVNPAKKTTDLETPVVDQMIMEAANLNMKSSYQSEFDWAPIKSIELRYKERPINGGFIKKAPMKLLNAHSSCQQCLYALELDTYGRGCTHDCVYCYAKTQLTRRAMWNNPIPFPIDLNALRKIFYTVFETDKRSKWREIFEKKIPIRIGCMSDSFMWMDRKYKVTQETLKILNHYKYPYTPLTRSDLIATDEYMELLDKDLCNVQFSISSTNKAITKQIEPGAPSPEKRLKALEKLNNNGFWTTVRINPIMPIYPDGYFSDKEFDWQGPVPKFDYSSFEMIKEIADTGTPSLIAGFGRFSSFALNQIEKACGTDLRIFFDRSKAARSVGDWRFSDEEIRSYYEKYKEECLKNAIEFTVCYIGYDENQFWDHQDLWSNKKDCCNIKDRVKSFRTDSREIPFDTRKRFTAEKCAKPIDKERLHEELGI